jgi:two-component system, OmpR family, response regulator
LRHRKIKKTIKVWKRTGLGGGDSRLTRDKRLFLLLSERREWQGGIGNIFKTISQYSMRILLAEDERGVSDLITKAFIKAGWKADAVSNGDAAYRAAAVPTHSVIVLDIVLPGMDGLTVLRKLRQDQIRTPVLVLSARDEVSQRVAGLELGADDYLGKPFAMEELIARVKALGRRELNMSPTELQVGDLKMNLLQHEVTRAGQKVELAIREFALLKYLMQFPDRVMTRMNICERVWNYHFDTGTNLVDVYINRLRRKIDDFHAVKLLHTIRGEGYILTSTPPKNRW